MKVHPESACLCPLCDEPIMATDLYETVEAHGVIYLVHTVCSDAEREDKTEEEDE